MNLYEISLSLYNNICVCGFLIRVRFLGFPISKEMEVLGFVLLYEDFFSSNRYHFIFRIRFIV